MPEPKPVSETSGGFAVRLFPMPAHKRIPADTMNGKIVLQRWVTGTNTHAYSPEVHFLNTPVIVQVENGHLVNLEGDAADVAAFRTHGRMVADKFGLDETLNHSWHHGLNPSTGYFATANNDPARWN